MAERSLVFPAAEYARRTGALQGAMRHAGLDALLLTTPADVFYVTGFLTRFWESPTRPWFVVVPESGMPVAVIPAIGTPLMGRTWISDIRSWDAPDPEDDGVSLLADTLCALTPEAARIGVPMGPETQLRMPLNDHGRVAAAIGRRRFVDATACVQRVREIKSEAEVENIRAACRVADAAFDSVPDFARAGAPLDRVFREFQASLLREGADWVAYVAGGAGRDGYDDVISPATSRPLETGDVLMLDTGAVRDGYFCDFDRNFAIGPASDAARRAYAALNDAVDAALAALRPGLRADELHRAMADAIRAAGASPCGGRFGHGVGLVLTEWPSISPRDTTTLREGMVLALEPGVEIAPGKIMVQEENVVLRESGPEFLSRRAAPALPEILS